MAEKITCGNCMLQARQRGGYCVGCPLAPDPRSLGAQARASRDAAMRPQGAAPDTRIARACGWWGCITPAFTHAGRGMWACSEHLPAIQAQAEQQEAAAQAFFAEGVALIDDWLQQMDDPAYMARLEESQNEEESAAYAASAFPLFTYTLETQDSGAISGVAWTNDNYDRGAPSGIASWPVRYKSVAEALKDTSGTHYGISGIRVEVRLDGVLIDAQGAPIDEEPTPAEQERITRAEYRAETRAADQEAAQTYPPDYDAWLAVVLQPDAEIQARAEAAAEQGGLPGALVLALAASVDAAESAGLQAYGLCMRCGGLLINTKNCPHCDQGAPDAPSV